MSKPVAIVTGGASGIGLAVTEHLLARGHKVVIADVDEKEGQSQIARLGEDAIFQKTDVSSYEQQLALFARAFQWGGDRLDFFAANAGIDDRQNLFQTDEALDENGLPLPLNLKTMAVDLDAVFQGIWLFKHFARKNKASKGGKIVITSSSAGLYPMETNPQYTAAKHALVGLTRAAGLVSLANDNITINCICPAFVVTKLCPPHVLSIFPKDHITPMSTVIKAFDTFLDDDQMSGQTVELTLDQLFFRVKPDYPNESQRWLGVDSKAFWDEAYKNPPVAKNGV